MLSILFIAFISLILLQISGLASSPNSDLQQMLYSATETFRAHWLIITLAADKLAIFAFSIATLAYLKVQRIELRPFVGLLLFTAATQLSNTTLKLIFAIERPATGFMMSSPSFPSGHTSLGSAFFLMFAVWLTRGYACTTRRIAITAAACLGVLVAISRVALGVHWPLDVLAALAEGAMFAYLYAYWLGKQSPTVLKRKKTATILLGVIAVSSIYCWLAFGQANLLYLNSPS